MLAAILKHLEMIACYKILQEVCKYLIKKKAGSVHADLGS
jgi:hypothetical protein